MRIIKRLARLYRHLCVLNDPVLDLPRIKNIAALEAHLARYTAGREHTTSLDIGCGDDPRNPFRASTLLGVDVKSKLPNVQIVDVVNNPFPFPDASFDYITAFDFIEHVPRIANGKNQFVELMSEVWRTLKPGGIFLSHTPCYPFPEAFQDPTHVNIITVDTFPSYFGQVFNFGEPYGCPKFDVLEQALVDRFELVSVLRKPAGELK